MMDDRNGMGPQGGYIGRITNDAREDEMEENVGQVNTMIGNLRNMAIDMGSELENQNRQVDRINLKVILLVYYLVFFNAFAKNFGGKFFKCGIAFECYIGYGLICMY